MAESVELDKILTRILNTERVYRIRKAHPEMEKRQFGGKPLREKKRKEEKGPLSETDEVVIGGERREEPTDGQGQEHGEEKEGRKPVNHGQLGSKIDLIA
ncbi:MAG TPA: hypothetical protein EYP53_05425 [Candidatus Latescibacteria bacterium]|nr:hypothetical protein [Candidatus Latescibacterota bacterium]